MPAHETRLSRDIGIVGTGRFGSYFATQLERAGYQVHRADARDEPASRLATIARACGSPLVIYAVPIRELERAIVETRHLLAPDATVMDVCSVKIMPCELLHRLLPGRATVGTHPLFGPQSAPERCTGQRAAVCAIGAGTAAGDTAAAHASDLFVSLGVTVVRCTPMEHDTQVARTQFLTHFIGRGAIRAGIDRMPLSTKSHDALMDIVDVVGSDSMELFEDMAAYNPMVRTVRAEFLAALHEIDRQLAGREQLPTSHRPLGATR
jgi:prephenate dehydrogenase